MKQYRYTALDKVTGKKIKGTIEASNELVLEKMLSDNGTILISSKEAKESKLLGFLSFGGKIKIKELTSLFITLEQLERSGIP